MPNIHDEIVALQTAVATLTTEVNFLSAQAIAQTSAINTLNTEVDSLTSQVSAQASEIAALQVEITQTPRIVANGVFDQSVETIS